jgi:hypothetical protein
MERQPLRPLNKEKSVAETQQVCRTCNHPRRNRRRSRADVCSRRKHPIEESACAGGNASRHHYSRVELDEFHVINQQ